MIKQLTTDEELAGSVSVIRESFKTVADELNLTQGNCPTHPSFITYDNLRKLIDSGARLFGFFENRIQVGFIAIEKSNDDLFYIEKLSIMPRYRHKGYGAKLLEYAFDCIKEQKGKMVSIGIIDEHTVLKEWYERIGFAEILKKRYEHLPFTVCFMEREIV